MAARAKILAGLSSLSLSAETKGELSTVLKARAGRVH